MLEINKIVAVLNDFEMLDAVLSKIVKLSKKHNAQVEVVFIQESKLFELPDFFRFKELPPEKSLDKEIIQKELMHKLFDLGYKDSVPVFVYIDDTVEYVLHQTKNYQNTIIVISYQDEIVKELVKKTHLPVLVMKNNTSKNYEKIVIPVDFTRESEDSILFAKTLFPDRNLELLHDYRYIIGENYIDLEGMPVQYNNIRLNDVLKKENKKQLELLATKMQLNANFITEESSLENDLVNFIKNNKFDLVVLSAHNFNTLFSGTVLPELLELSPVDLLIYS